MDVRADFAEAVGRTPLIRLRRASELTGCTILGKAEFMNPGGSVKDRAALYMVLDAEQRGTLRPGGLIVEGTAGNTGIGLALVGNARGYRTLVVIPQTQSQEKKDALRLAGAQLKEVPAVPYSDRGHYVHVAERLAAELAGTEPHGVLYANQWDNLANREGHVQVVIAAADPLGAGMYHYVRHGELRSEGSSITEGIGQNRITGNLRGAPIDDAYQIPDAEALPVLFALLREEGLCLGGSSGINVAGAIRLARDLGPGHTVVTILADSGTRYQSKLFNPEFLRGRKLPVPDWLDA